MNLKVHIKILRRLTEDDRFFGAWEFLEKVLRERGRKHFNTFKTWLACYKVLQKAKELRKETSEDFVQDVDSGNIYVIRDGEIVRRGAG